MTKAELIKDVEDYYKDRLSIEAVKDAVDRYSAALLQQTDCSTQLPPNVEQEVKQALWDLVNYIRSPQLPALPADQYINDYLNSRYGSGGD